MFSSDLSGTPPMGPDYRNWALFFFFILFCAGANLANRATVVRYLCSVKEGRSGDAVTWRIMDNTMDLCEKAW